MRITIGIPFYNNRHTIEHAIRSVLRQSFDDWELLLLDDGSTDGSLEPARAFADPRVRVISDGRNRGLAYRLNQIAHEARGIYLARMDADDVMHPRRIEKQVRFLDAHPEVDLVCSAAYVIDAEGRVRGLCGSRPLPSHASGYLRHDLIIHPTVMARREWFRDNPYDTSFPRCQDYELWCRTCTHSVFAKIPEPLLFYRGVGVSRPSTYLLRKELDRTVLRRYGRPLVGGTRTALMIAGTHLKGVIYGAASVVGLTDSLLRMRLSRLSSAELESANRAMEMATGAGVLRRGRRDAIVVGP